MRTKQLQFQLSVFSLTALEVDHTRATRKHTTIGKEFLEMVIKYGHLKQTCPGVAVFCPLLSLCEQLSTKINYVGSSVYVILELRCPRLTAFCDYIAISHTFIKKYGHIK